ncbi:MAG: hypothetical protein IJ560_00985 [Alphaproteobacteria bacterium]|nr:hypothetical protein [Alphaproteobacteria bacterium]
MDGIKKLLSTLMSNLGITIVLLIAIVLFVTFSNGLLPGIIAALSALVAYTCCEMLYKEFRKPTEKPRGKRK